jgi:hypothetical protein
MLAIGIIYSIEKSEWEIPVVVHPTKNEPKNLRICVDVRGLNKITPIDSFPTPFADEIINEVMGYECYSFIDDFSRYNEVSIA